MRKIIHRAVAVGLTACLLCSQAVTAFAEQDDSNSGPGMHLGDEYATEATTDGGPGSNLDTPTRVIGGGQDKSDERETQTGDSQAAGDSQTDSSQAAGETQTSETQATGETPAGETQATGETQVPEEGQAGETQPAEDVQDSAPLYYGNPFLQVQVYRPDNVWTYPIIDDTPVPTEDQGFKSICIFLKDAPGDVLYRSYTSAHGWSSWAMNGEHTTEWEDLPLVEAFQLRFKGVPANAFDVNYTGVLNDGTELDWAKNGETLGTMGTGKYLTSIRISLWQKGTEGAVYKRDRRMDTAIQDGITFPEGKAVYNNGTGEPFTGWGWVDQDRYYFVENQCVTGWQYLDGYKYYFDETGKLITDLEGLIEKTAPYQIKINKLKNCTTIYAKDGDNGYIIPVKSFLCSTGDDTPIGTFKSPEKYRWRLMVTDEYCQYLTRLTAGQGILLHSVIYERQDNHTLKAFTYNYLGATPSHGCIRFTTGDAKWIYDNCPVGTTITVYESEVPGPYDRPAIQKMIPDTQTWDPTDPNV